MQIMPTTYNDFNINQTSYALTSSDYLSSFSQSFDNALRDESYYTSKYDDSQRTQAEEEEKAAERRRNMRSESDSFDINDHLDSVYGSARSPYEPEPTRFIPSEMENLAQSLMDDGASIDAINVVKAMANKPGGVTAEQVTNAVEDAMRGTRNSLSDQEIADLQSFCERLNPDDPDKLYSDIRYGSGKTGVEAIEEAFGNMQGSVMAKMSEAELTAVGRALNLSQGTINGLTEKLKDFNSNSLSQKDVEAILGNAEAEIQTQAESYKKTMASLEENLASTTETAEAREAEALEAQSREAKTVTQARLLMEDTSMTRALGDAMNRNERAGRANEESYQSKQEATKLERAQEEVARDKLATTMERMTTQNTTSIQNQLQNNKTLVEQTAEELTFNDKLFATLQSEKFDSLRPQDTKSLLNNAHEINGRNTFASTLNDSSTITRSNSFVNTANSGESFRESFGESFANSFGEGRNENSFSSGAFGDSAKFEYAFASASQSQYINTGFTPNSSQGSVSGIDVAAYRNDVREQVQSSITKSVMNMSGNGEKTIEVSLDPVELGQLNIALSIRNGEVNATIQAEKAESATVINAQMDAIRQELENQGFKVANIEVEVGLSQDNFADTRQDWQGSEYYNSSQQQSEQAQYLEQLQILNKLAAIDRGEKISLARNMQGISTTEGQSANSSLNADMTGVHIIA